MDSGEGQLTLRRVNGWTAMKASLAAGRWIGSRLGQAEQHATRVREAGEVNPLRQG